MSDVLVLAEFKGAEPKKVTLEMLTVAREIAADTGGKVIAAALSQDAVGVGEQVGPYGASKVCRVNGVSQYHPQGYAEVLAKLVAEEKPDIVLLPATAMGKDLAPRLAAKLDVGLASDIVGFRLEGGEFIAKRPVFAGKAFNEVAFLAKPALATVRPNVFSAVPGEDGAATEEATDAAVGEALTKLVEKTAGDEGQLDLTEADRVVSGGRSLKSKENFAILRELAEVLGATVGASRAAVDAGYADPSMQVGQTGKVVNPSLYIACGISGAIQHQAGMRTSKTIVAINKDKKAPIFQLADFGIVADLFEAVPLLTQEIKKQTQ